MNLTKTEIHPDPIYDAAVRLLVSAAVLAILALAGPAGSDVSAAPDSGHASAAHLASPPPPDPEPAAIVRAASSIAVIVHATVAPACPHGRPCIAILVAANPRPTDVVDRFAGPRTFPLLI
jgi:hypothetical protein